MDIKEKVFTDYFKLLFIFLCITTIHSSVSFSENIIKNMVEDPTLTGERIVNADPNVAIILDLSFSMSLESSNPGEESEQLDTQVGNWTLSDNDPGLIENRSRRIDIALSVLFDFFDADNSLENSYCTDDGSTSPISCKDYLYTPLRNVESIITGDSELPIENAPDFLANQLTDNDADILGVRFQPMFYSGEGNGEACQAKLPPGQQSGGLGNTNTVTVIESQSAYGMAPDGFKGGSGTDLQDVWEFYRSENPGEGTPLALVLGFDDEINESATDNDNATGNYHLVKNDALLAFHKDMPSDPALNCRPQFTILITDGTDSCSGDCDRRASSCNGNSGASNNSNKRSSIKAVNNLRTYFSRNAVNSDLPELGTVKKEVLTFIIGMNIDDDKSIRSINAMALAGGTHTTGIIQHTNPTSNTQIGSVNIYDVIPGDENDEFEVYRQIARGEGLSSDNPDIALLNVCGNPREDGSSARCSFKLNGTTDTNVFTNHYFDSGTLPDGSTPIDLNGFAFFPDTPEELKDALEKIVTNIKSFTTTGVAPSAPQTAGNITLRDRVFLALTNPLAGERLWEGRLALYSFVEDPNVPGRKLIVRKPDSEDYTTTTDLEQFSIFTDGRLNSNAREYHWEAGTILANRTASRNIFTVGTGISDIDISDTGVIRYLGDTIDFDSTNITPESIGISDDDVRNPIPQFCQDDIDGISDCNAGELDCDENIANDDCINCVKECLKNQIINYISGDTGIVPEYDPDDPLPYICSDDPVNCSVKLGDIFHSSPTTVASPSVLFFDTGFQIFTKAFRERSAVVYAGANDGGLHAFHAGELANPSGTSTKNPFTGRMESLPFYDAGNGSEMFFYIPPTFLPDAISVHDPHNHFEGFTVEENTDEGEVITPPDFNPDYRFGDLKNFVLGTTRHRSFFDGTVTIADVFIDGFDNGISTGQNGFCNLEETDPGVKAESDGLISRCGKEWHTVMISGFRNGGGGFTSLDVTNADCNTNEPGICDIGDDYPIHLWSLFDRDFGNTWSNPKVARVRLKAGSGDDEIFADRWVAFVGGGIDPVPEDTTTFGNAFYAIDITTGQIIYKFHKYRSIPDELGSDQETLSLEMKCELASDPGVFDINSDGYADLVYIGDTCGRLWRFDVSQPLETESTIESTGLTLEDNSLDRGSAVIEAPIWRAGIAFCANETEAECRTNDSPAVPDSDVEPIFFPPTSVIDDIGRRHIIFQTGNRRNPTQIAIFENDVAVPGTHNAGRLYNFIDTFIPSFLAGSLETSTARMLTSVDITRTITLTRDGNSDLFNSNVTETTEDTDTGNGEFIVEYPNNAGDDVFGGEKGTGTPWVIDSVLVFLTYAPTPSDLVSACEFAPGNTRVFALDYITGQPKLHRIAGAKAVNNNISNSTAGIEIFEGLSSGATLSSTPNSVVLSFSTSGSSQGGGAGYAEWEMPLANQTQTLFWEEVL